MCRVLVIEDEPSILKFLTQALLLTGFDVVAVTDGEAGLAEIRGETAFDVILLDLMMPVLSGWEVLARMENEGLLDEAPVIVVTASSQETDQRRARAMGAVDCLVKPFTVREMAICVRQVVGTAA